MDCDDPIDVELLPFVHLYVDGVVSVPLTHKYAFSVADPDETDVTSMVTIASGPGLPVLPWGPVTPCGPWGPVTPAGPCCPSSTLDNVICCSALIIILYLDYIRFACIGGRYGI